MSLQVIQATVNVPSNPFSAYEEFFDTKIDYAQRSPMPYSTEACLDNCDTSDDGSEDDEEMMISLKEDVESNTVTFYDNTYEAIFSRLKAAVLCLDEEDLSLKKKRRISTAAQEFCQAVLTAEGKVPSLLAKHIHMFVDFLMETMLESEGDESCLELLATWFSLLSRHAPGTIEHALKRVTIFLSEMIVGERSDRGLENLLFHLEHLLCLSSQEDIQNHTLLINKLLIPLYRLKCFYLSPKHKTRQSRNDKRPLLLRSRLHKVFVFCLLSFPESVDVIIAGLFRLWDSCRHLRVNPVREEVELMKMELKKINVSHYQANKISDLKMKLTLSHQRGIINRKKKTNERKKIIRSLKHHALIQLRSLGTKS